MKITDFRQAKINDKKKKAYTLYKQGLTLREVGKAVNMSHEWVRQAVIQLMNEEYGDKKLSTGTLDNK